MPPKRGQRGSARRGAPTRGRGSAAARGKSFTHHAGVKNTQTEKKRPVQPRIAAALASAVVAAPEQEISLAVQEDLQETSKWEWTPTKVQRIQRPDFMCNSDSLYFAYYCGLNTSADTEIVALNLMDYFLQPPWVKELWGGRLHATCFLLACNLTGVDNDIEASAKAVEVQAAGLAERYGVHPQDLEVPVEEVRKAYAAVLERREHLKGLVGEYAYALGQLPTTLIENVSEETPANVEEAEEPSERGPELVVEEVTEPAQKDLEEDRIDFDVFDEPETQSA